MTRILIDQDSTIYDLSTPWYKLHNDEYGHIHEITADKVYTWDTAQICRDNNCPARIYDYFTDRRVWSDGTVIENSVEITKQWITAGYELGVLTTAANAMSMPHKVEWLQKYFPHIPNILLVYNTHIKHWLDADFLIDDGIHNHKYFKGISIVYNTAWNQADTRIPRARDWNHVRAIVSRGVGMLEVLGKAHYKRIESILNDEVNANIL